MLRIESGATRTTGGSAHPAMLLALAIGIAIGACLSGAPARSAEATSGSPGSTPAGQLSGDFGTPKLVRTVPVPAEAGTSPAPVPAPATAATWRYDGDAEYRRCIDSSEGTNMAWGVCGGALVEREDARLNAAWKKVYAAGAETKSKDLLDEQRAWNLFKEASCRFYASGTFGREGQVLSFPVCRAGIIAQRTATLDGYGEDGGR